MGSGIYSLIEYFVGMFPYLFLLLMFPIICIGFKDKGLATKFFFVLVFLISALRYDVGWDYLNYLEIIKNSGNGLMVFEFLEHKVCEFSNDIGFPQFFFIINSLATCLFFYKGIVLMSKNKMLSSYVFLCMPFYFLTSLSIIRFALALSIVFYALARLLHNKKILQFVFFIFFAVNIHNGALVALLAIPLFYYDAGLKFNVFILLLTIVFYLSNVLLYIQNFLFSNQTAMALEGVGKLQQYIGYSYSGGLSMISYLYYGINIINLLYYKKILNSSIDEEDVFRSKKLIMYFNIGCCLMIFFQADASLSGRLSSLFYSTIVLIVPLYCKLSKNVRFTKSVIYIILSLLFVYQLVIKNGGVNSNRWSTYVPYQFYFSNK